MSSGLGTEGPGQETLQCPLGGAIVELLKSLRGASETWFGQLFGLSCCAMEWYINQAFGWAPSCLGACPDICKGLWILNWNQLGFWCHKHFLGFSLCLLLCRFSSILCRTGGEWGAGEFDRFPWWRGWFMVLRAFPSTVLGRP